MLKNVKELFSHANCHIFTNTSSTFIRENLKKALDMECRICILTDASRWARIFLPLRPMLSGQIEGADTVLINKIDLADEELLSKMENDITDINPDTNIYRCCGNTEIDQTVWSAVIGEV